MGPVIDSVSAGHNGGLNAVSGNGMATPHVPGVAAPWAEQGRSANGKVVFEDLKSDLPGSVFHLQGARAGLGRGLVRAPQ